MNTVTEKPETQSYEDNFEVIDDCFKVWETRFGLWSTETLQGRKMLTSPSKEAAITMTRWHLKCEQENTLHLYTRVINDGIVDGKL